MRAEILGIGCATPNFSLLQDELTTVAYQLSAQHTCSERVLKELYRLSGVSRRGSVLLQDQSPAGLYDFYSGAAEQVSNGGASQGPSTAARMRQYSSHATPLAMRAATAALSNSAVRSSDITELVTISCTGFQAPGLDLELCKQLQLPPTVHRTQIGFMGCHGALNGIRAAEALCKTTPNSKVLVVAVELCSLHYNFSSDSDQLVTNALFSDGAAALVMQSGNDGESDSIKVIRNASYIVPNSAELMSWRIGDYGFIMNLSPRVPSVMEDLLAGWVRDELKQVGLSISDIGGWAIHPGGPRILEASRRALDLSDDALAPSRHVLEAHGNMSSPTVLFILDELRRRELPRPWMMLAFGPGLTLEASIQT